MSMYGLPIDAEFHADFQNVYFCIPILRIFRVMANPRPKKARFPWNPQKRAFFGLVLAITRKILKICIQKYTFLKSAWNSASIELLHETFWRSSKIFIFSRCRKWQVATGDPRRPQKILKKNQNDFHHNGTLSPKPQKFLEKKRYYGTP